MALINGTLVGIIGNDPVTRQVGETATVTEIQVAYENRRSSNAQTQWVKVEVWGKLGTEVVAKYARKGDPIVVTFNDMRTEAYLTRDGQPGAKTVYRASGIELMGQREPATNNEPEF